MDHNYIIDNDLIDKYLLYQLTKEEESELEEHLLFCDECLKTLGKRKKIIGIIRNKLPGEINRHNFNISKKNPAIKFTFFLKIAASIIILVSFTWLGISLFDRNGKEKKVVIVPTDNKDSITEEAGDTIKEQKIIDSIKKEKNLQLAEAYRNLPEFENYIDNQLRGDGLKVLSPASNSWFKPNEAILIKWNSTIHDSLIFIVFDNKAKIIFEKQIDTSYTYQQKLMPGLYYWQLETMEEALFTSKFTI